MAVKTACRGSGASACAIFESGNYDKVSKRAACPICRMQIRMIGKHVNRVFARHSARPGMETRGTAS